MLHKRFLITGFLFFILLSPHSYASNVYTLNKAIRTALHNNYLIKGALEQIKVKRYGLKSATASMLPALSLDYSASKLKSNPYSIMPSGGKRTVGSKTNINWNLKITQPVFEGFYLINKRLLAKLGVDVAEVERNEAILNVAYRVKIAYFNVLLAKKQLLVADRQLRQLKSHVEDAKLFYKEGLIAYNDLLQSEVALSNSLQYKIQSEANINYAISNFNTLLNLNLNNNTQFESINTVSEKTFYLNRLLGYALLHNPQLKLLHFRVRQTDINKKLAQSQYYPWASAYAAYEQSGQNMLATNNEYSNQYNEVIGIQVHWTLFNWFKTSYNVQEAEHQKFAVENQLHNLINNISLDVKKTLLYINTSKHNISVAKLAIRLAKENYRITNLQYQQQIVTSTKVLDAQTALTTSELDYYKALYGYYMYVAQLENIIGSNLYWNMGG